MAVRGDGCEHVRGSEARVIIMSPLMDEYRVSMHEYAVWIPAEAYDKGVAMHMGEGSPLYELGQRNVVVNFGILNMNQVGHGNMSKTFDEIAIPDQYESQLKNTDSVELKFMCVDLRELGDLCCDLALRLSHALRRDRVQVPDHGRADTPGTRGPW